MRKNAVYAFLIPSLAGFCIFFLVPFVGGLGYAFDVNGGFGFDNFARTLQNEAFHLALTNTLLYMLVCVPLNLFLPLFVACGVRSIGNRTLFTSKTSYAVKKGEQYETKSIYSYHIISCVCCVDVYGVSIICAKRCAG